MESLAKLIIRPPRSIYEESDLGPREFHVRDVRGTRKDFQLRGLGGTLECSHFLPVSRHGQSNAWNWKRTPAVIYLHGNASNRLEALKFVGPVLERGVSLVCFDSAGCGLSQGEYVSLGWHERDDLAEVVRYVREETGCGPVALWGWSMGAVTALRYVEKDPTVAAACFDSPFTSLRTLCEETAGRLVPSLLTSTVLESVRTKVLHLASFDINELELNEYALRSSVPALFIHAKGDSYINVRHCMELHEAYSGRKELLLLDGDHVTERDNIAIDQTMEFLDVAFRPWKKKQGCHPHRIFLVVFLTLIVVLIAFLWRTFGGTSAGQRFLGSCREALQGRGVKLPRWLPRSPSAACLPLLASPKLRGAACRPHGSSSQPLQAWRRRGAPSAGRLIVAFAVTGHGHSQRKPLPL